MNHSSPQLTRCRVHHVKKRGLWPLFGGRVTATECAIWEVDGQGVEVSDGAELFLKSSKLQKNKLNGIWVRNAGSLTVDDCDITDNVYSGVAVVVGKLQAVNCRLTGNGAAGVWAENGSEGSVEGCTLTNNSRGASFLDRGAKVKVVRSG